jgi:glycerol-3-phosphate dehydrogenase
MFIIPRGEVIHIGTTDTFTSSPDDWKITEEDIEYIISSARSIIPILSRKDIIESFSGIRPLFGSGSDPGKVTRKSSVIINGNVVSILGGKITDYRLTAQSVARIINKGLPHDRRLSFRGLPTIDYRRNGSDAIRQAVFNECALNEEDVLRRRIGARIYTKDAGKSIESEVRDKVKRLLTDNRN